MSLSSSATTTTTSSSSSSNSNKNPSPVVITPFPSQARDLLQRHKARSILIQVGTSSSHSFGHRPLDAVDPWSTAITNNGQKRRQQRLDLGPSGVLVRATVQVSAPSSSSSSTEEGLTREQCKALEERRCDATKTTNAAATSIQRMILEDWGGQAQIESLLQDLVAQRIVLAPLFSVSIRRLHRHSLVQVSCQKQSSPQSTTAASTSIVELDYELVLPMEGAALSSEGMHAFATTLAPCHNQSGIFSWNDPQTLSDILAVKRQSTARHSWWIQLLENEETSVSPEQEPVITTTTSVTKGLQFQQPLSIKDYVAASTAILATTIKDDDTASNNNNNNKNRTVSLADIFPSSTRHRRCPFVQESTLETLLAVTPSSSSNNHHPQQQVEMIRDDKEAMVTDDYRDSHGNSISVLELTPNQWKNPWMTILAPTPPNINKPQEQQQQQQQQQPKWSVHQTLQRPRGVAYSGQLITQAVVHTPSSSGRNCHVSVDLQWFLPPVVQPTWQSLRVVWENEQEQIEQELDWKQDLNGQIAWINGEQEQHHTVLPGEIGTIHFRIPNWNVTTTHENRDSRHTLTVSLDYRPAFLSFENFPGDANRGVEIPPAMATFVETCQPPLSSSQPLSSATPILLYSNSLLLLPPVPDMSMPFNVLSMTCSLYAFIIGSLLNLLIRKSSERVQVTYDPSKMPPPNKLQQLKAKLITKVKSLKRGKQ